ncbi:hypothetical protein ATANTOWER_027667 [Ataeniobius toweri]|uniref:DM domain-containing protein n=1 Tax=Ataeniobius toweri TaxID=208326 RepID=A0ABU7BD12_9TELE|nr:hypothetical protein [Ataeniobius toweri]
MVTAMSEPRQPKCSRCRHHGIITRKKGHSRCCPFSGCRCWKCGLLTQRAQVKALHRNLSRTRKHVENPDKRPGPRTTGEPAASAGPRDPESLDLDVWSHRHDPKGEPESGSHSRDAPDALVHVGDSGQPAPLPQLLSPIMTCSSSSFPSSSDLLLHLPYLPPVPAGLYDGLCRPLMIPHILQGVMSYPPPAEVRPQGSYAVWKNLQKDCRLVFFPLHPPPPPPNGSPEAPPAASAHKYRA